MVTTTPSIGYSINNSTAPISIGQSGAVNHQVRMNYIGEGGALTPAAGVQVIIQRDGVNLVALTTGADGVGTLLGSIGDFPPGSYSFQAVLFSQVTLPNGDILLPASSNIVQVIVTPEAEPQPISFPLIAAIGIGAFILVFSFVGKKR